MKKNSKSVSRILALSLFVSLTFFTTAFAHKPQIITENNVVITDPEISRAFYDTLDSEPRTYFIDSPKDFDLYVNLLVPESSNPDGRYFAEIYKQDGESWQLLEILDGDTDPWTEFHEEYANDTYLKGPEFKDHVPLGKYEIVVSGEPNEGKYVLAVGETEAFGIKDVWSVFTTVPQLKKDFFDVSIFTLFTAKLGFILILGVLLFLVITFAFFSFVAYLSRIFLFKNKRIFLKKNIDTWDRIIRFTLGFLILIWAISSWNIFLGGAGALLIYEAIAKWCFFCVIL